MGTRKEPLRYVCKSCGKQCETFNTGNKGQFCTRECRHQGFRKDTWESAGRYKQRGYWMLRRNIEGHYQHKFEHVYTWEKHNGPKPEGFIIHHINEIKTDNRIENLHLMQIGDHIKLHKLKYQSHDERKAEYARRKRESRKVSK